MARRLTPTPWADISFRPDPGLRPRLYTARPLRGLNWQHFVHRAAAKALQIESDILEPKLAKSPRQFINQLFPQYPVHLSRRYLESNELVVMAHSELSESKLS